MRKHEGGMVGDKHWAMRRKRERIRKREDKRERLQEKARTRKSESEGE